MLVVLDGFGIGDGGPADATARAHAPFFAHARRDLPMARIETAGEAVGLPPGQMGNSEVGHMTLGSGRIVEMDMTRISRLLAGGGAARNPVLQQAFATLAASGEWVVTLGPGGLGTRVVAFPVADDFPDTTGPFEIASEGNAIAVHGEVVFVGADAGLFVIDLSDAGGG